MATSISSPGRQVLHSWKEISAYTGRGVRTIQRYETQFGFPIHRPAGSPRSAVLAFSDEVDQWLAGSPTRVGQLPLDSLTLDQHARMHSVWMQANLGYERAEAMAERLLATKTLLDQLIASLESGRVRRAELQTRLRACKASLSSLPPPHNRVST